MKVFIIEIFDLKYYFLLYITLNYLEYLFNRL